MFSGSLAWKEQALLGYFLVYACCSLLWYSCLGYVGSNKETPFLTRAIPQVSRGLSHQPSFYLSENSYAFSLCYAQSFLIVKERAWEQQGYFTLAKPELPIVERFKICKNHNQPLLFFLLHMYMNLIRDSFGCPAILVTSDPRRSRADQV